MYPKSKVACLGTGKPTEATSEATKQNGRSERTSPTPHTTQVTRKPILPQISATQQRFSTSWCGLPHPQSCRGGDAA